MPSAVAESLTIGVVGGASGVGKTTLLGAAPEIDRINTGDLFKKRMTLVSRDEIRSSDWSQYEAEVADELAYVSGQSIAARSPLVIDTHFAAKLNGKHYRIGLKRTLVFELAANILAKAKELGVPVRVPIVHVDSNPHGLLKRRRLDSSRKRELVPSDCMRALTRNRQCHGQYLFEFARAAKDAGLTAQDHLVPVSLLNEDLSESQNRMANILRGA